MGRLIQLIAPNSNTQEWERCLTESSIVSVCLVKNRKKYLQSYNTPCLTELLLSEIGINNNDPALNHTLAGTFTCQNIHPITQAYLNKLSTPPTLNNDLSFSTITEQDNINDLKKQVKKHPHHNHIFTTVYGKPTPLTLNSTKLTQHLETSPFVTEYL